MSGFLSPHRCVHIGLEAPEETDVTLLVSYVVSNASWSSAYDVRVLPVAKEMKVGTTTTSVFEGKVVHNIGSSSCVQQ